MPPNPPQHDPTDELTKAYDQYSDAIFRHCYFRVFNRERGKELMQEAFMRTWEYLSQGKKIDNIRAFLYRIANNLIIDEWRKKKEISLEKLQEEGWDPVGTDQTLKMQGAYEEKRILATLQKIDKTYRDIVVMRYIDGLSPAEIATIMGESANTISVRLHRGIKQLRLILNREG